LAEIEAVYDDAPTTLTSTGVDCSNYKFATLQFTLDSTGAPTTFLFEVETSNDGVNYAKYCYRYLARLIFDDIVCATAISRSYTFPINAAKIRVKTTAVGTDAIGNTFEVTNADLYLGN
jgi:hypothetical protein